MWLRRYEEPRVAEGRGVCGNARPSRTGTRCRGIFRKGRGFRAAVLAVLGTRASGSPLMSDMLPLAPCVQGGVGQGAGP